MLGVMTPLRLNLGCWVFRFDTPEHIRDGWVNIDLNPRYPADILADVCTLPYPDESVDEIYAGHVLEHIPQNGMALPEWNRVLKTGGFVTIVVPELARCIRAHREGYITRQFLNMAILGGADDGDALQMHHRVYTDDILRQEMMDCGFRVEWMPDDPNIRWQVMVRGYK